MQQTLYDPILHQSRHFFFEWVSEMSALKNHRVIVGLGGLPRITLTPGVWWRRRSLERGQVSLRHDNARVGSLRTPKLRNAHPRTAIPSQCLLGESSAARIIELRGGQ